LEKKFEVPIRSSTQSSSNLTQSNWQSDSLCKKSQFLQLNQDEVKISELGLEKEELKSKISSVEAEHTKVRFFMTSTVIALAHLYFHIATDVKVCHAEASSIKR
jgi:hypothetical protein